ncbi:MAG: hypothetical protein IPK01_18805 [Acidobacteria bacterium]|nr:hypothetical protein [Acidobacteriota bacterium]
MISKSSISMPKSLEEYARSRVRNGGYGSISEYFRELVRLDQRFDTAKREPQNASDPSSLASAARHSQFSNRYR